MVPASVTAEAERIASRSPDMDPADALAFAEQNHRIRAAKMEAAAGVAALANGADGAALAAPYTGRAGVLDRPNSPRAVAWIGAHWGLPSSMAQAIANLERANARLVAAAILAAREASK